MILIGENQYRTLDDDFYVNGKKVLEAYANGIKVYPVTPRTGTLVKFRGKRIFNDVRSFEYNHYYNWEDTIVKRQQMEKYERRLTGEASFVAVCETKNISEEDEKYRHLIANGKLLEECLSMHGSYEHRLWYTNPPTIELDGELALGDEKNITSNIGVEGDISGNGKMLYKQNIEPYRLPSIIHWIDSVYFAPDPSVTEVTITADNPYAWMIEEHNNKIYSRDNIDFETIDDKLYYNENRYVTINESNSSISLMLCGEYGFAHDCLAVALYPRYANTYTYTINGTIRNKPVNEKIGFYGGDTHLKPYFRATIPITEIMYIGSRFTAPDWARNVYESDLDF